MQFAGFKRQSTKDRSKISALDGRLASAEVFFRSQTDEGRKCLPERYDDSGFTDGNMERPAPRQGRRESSIDQKAAP